MPDPVPASTTPTDAALREARYVTFTRLPTSPSAHALTSAVLGIILPHLQSARRRPIGPKAQSGHISDTGIVLGALLRDGLKGRPASAQRRTHGAAWRDGPIGCGAFWAKVDAMVAAGLVGSRLGVRTAPLEWSPGSLQFTGLPTRLWLMPAMIDLAGTHDVTAATFWTDWKVNRHIEQKPVAVPFTDLVTIADLGNRGQRLAVPDEAAESVDAMRRGVAALNECVAKADVRGCRAPTFRRGFNGNLLLGGRFYAAGTDNCQNLRREERRDITINGEAVAEVDLQASFLTVFLALTGTTELPRDDLYDLGPDLPRAAIKAWFTQTFGGGKLANRWGNNVAAEVKAIKATSIREAALRKYPALADLATILPADLRGAVPKEHLGKAVGLHLMFRESDVVDGALSYIMAMRGVALPLHDALLVPLSHAEHARAGLESSFRVRVGIVPRVKVTRWGTADDEPMQRATRVQEMID